MTCLEHLIGSSLLELLPVRVVHSLLLIILILPLKSTISTADGGPKSRWRAVGDDFKDSLEQSEELVLPSEAVSESVCVTWCAECMCEARCIAKHTYVMVLLSEEEEPEAEDATTLRNAQAEQRHAELDDDDHSNKRSGRL